MAAGVIPEVNHNFEHCLRIVVMTGRKYLDIGKAGLAHLLYHVKRGGGECGIVQGDKDEAGRELVQLLAEPPFLDLVLMNRSRDVASTDLYVAGASRPYT